MALTSKVKSNISRSGNYLDAVSEFINFLSTNGLTLDEVLSHIVLVVLAPLDAEGITLDFLNEKNQVENLGRWGMPFEMIKDYVDIYNFTDRYPSTDTLRYRTITYVNTLPDWGDDYPLLKDLPYTTGAKSFIAFPIEKAHTPVAALGILSRELIHPNTEIESFLKTVGSVFSMYMFSQDTTVEENSNQSYGKVLETHTLGIDTTDELTERQQVILRLLSENRTNLAISNLLGYSESTVKQETIKIYTKLNCSGRKEAARIYQAHMTKFGNIK